MRDKILIITSKFDEHADYIISLLNENGCADRVIRLNTEDFRNNVKYSFNGMHFQILIGDSNISFTDEEVSKVWYRRPLEEKLDIPDEGVKKFLKSQVKQFLQGLYYCLHESAMWINDLQADMFAKNKLYQLQVADQVGFITPKVMISNDYKQISQFFDDNEIVCNKSLSVPRYSYEGKSYSYMTRLITKEECDKNKESLAVCPNFFEGYIDKEYDIRVVVLEDKIFAFAIYSQDEELAKVDMRGISPLQLRHEFIELPDDIKEKIMLFMKKQNLWFSSMDLIYTKNHEYVFIENNCNGQWLWLENVTGVRLSKVFVEKLLK